MDRVRLGALCLVCLLQESKPALVYLILHAARLSDDGHVTRKQLNDLITVVYTVFVEHSGHQLEGSFGTLALELGIDFRQLQQAATYFCHFHKYTPLKVTRR
jgi:hypothetical protein